MNQYPWITLQHSGRREVSFRGIELAYATDKERTGEKRIRWSTVKLCENRESDRGYFVGIGHLTSVHRKLDEMMYEWVPDLNAALMVIRRHAPEFEDEIRDQLDKIKQSAAVAPTRGSFRQEDYRPGQGNERAASNKR